MSHWSNGYTCPHCGAELCNQFALFLHIRRCQAYIGKQEPEEGLS